MRRLLAIGGVLAIAAVVAILVAAGSSGASSDYRVDIVFDDARGLVPGQLVKIAGAQVGTIQDVVLTPRYRARIQASIDPRFAPFRSDATCTIRPEGLLAENYVSCDPGSPSGRPLRGTDGQAPTVPVTHTTEPVNLTDLFNIATVPVRDRVRVLLAELGLGVAGRGDDINAILRRANPALAQARRVVAILHGQQSQLAATIDASDTLLAQLARRSDAVQAFLTHAAAVSERVAQHRGSLAQAIRRLPPLLAEARPSLRDLDTVAIDATPLLTELRRTAPALNRLSSDVGPFVTLARPALARLKVTLAKGTVAARRSAPLVTALRNYTHLSLPNARTAGKLFVNLLDRGAIENLLGLFYHGAAAGSRYDRTSHILPARISVTACSPFATTPVAGCSANQPGTATAATTSRVLDYLLR